MSSSERQIVYVAQRLTVDGVCMRPRFEVVIFPTRPSSRTGSSSPFPSGSMSVSSTLRLTTLGTSCFHRESGHERGLYGGKRTTTIPDVLAEASPQWPTAVSPVLEDMGAFWDVDAPTTSRPPLVGDLWIAYDVELSPAFILVSALSTDDAATPSIHAWTTLLSEGFSSRILSLSVRLKKNKVASVSRNMFRRDKRSSAQGSRIRGPGLYYYHRRGPGKRHSAGSGCRPVQTRWSDSIGDSRPV